MHALENSDVSAVSIAAMADSCEKSASASHVEDITHSTQACQQAVSHALVLREV